MQGEEYRRWKVTVITAVLNGAQTLNRTIASIAAQSYPDLEYIVVDGGSTDGTLDIVARYRDQINVLVEGPDSGLADAMNKGLARSTGDLVLFLHADDRFLDTNALARALPKVTSLDRIWAFEVLFDEGASQRCISPRPFNLWARFRNPLPHQGVLVPKRTFDRLGNFDTRWQIVMDYQFWIRAMKVDVPLSRISLPLSVMGSEGVSSRLDWPGLDARFREEQDVQLSNADTWQWRAAYAVYWPLYRAYRRAKSTLRLLG